MKTFGFTLSVLATIFLLAAFYSGPMAEAQGAKVLDGKQIFLAQKCNMCHSVSTEGITPTMKTSKAPDLVNITVDAKTLNGYLRKTADLNGKKHMKQFTGSDEELGALIAWIQKQKK